MKLVRLQQGTPEWHAHRAQHFNASDAPAMMGCSPHKTRSQLLREVHTGLAADVDADNARIFADGHRFEALARPLAEAIVGEDLYPCVGVEGRYSASFDGLTLGGDVAFEHKTLSAALADVMHADIKGHELPLHYKVQMEQQCLVSGAGKVLFMASKWDGETLVEKRHCWYIADMALRMQIVAGWSQFEKDLAAYVPPATSEPVRAEHMESLPAVFVRTDGALTVAGNLPEFAIALRAFIERMPTAPSTDNEFATLDKACKALKLAEEELDKAERQALAGIVDVETMRRLVADNKKLSRDTRLAAEKMVDRRKTEIKESAVLQARAALDAHIADLNGELAPMRLQPVVVDFALAIKGLRSIDSLRDALATALANGKIAADSQARVIRANVAYFKLAASEFTFLFADIPSLVHKAADDFQAVVAARLAKHRADEAAREAKRQADEAARIAAAEESARQQERARLAAEQAQEQRQREAAALRAQQDTERQAAQQVLKATPAMADATDRATPATTSPVVGPTGVGQAADAAPVAEEATINLCQIKEWLRMPSGITREFVESLGVQPTIDGRAILFTVSQRRHLKGALIKMLEELPA